MPNHTFDHLHLMSPDPFKTAEFYVKHFGAKQVNDPDPNGERVTVNLDLNGTTMLISKAAGDAQTGLVHFGIQSDDLDKSIEELKAAGVEFTMEKREIRSDFIISFLLAPENVSIELQSGGL